MATFYRLKRETLSLERLPTDIPKSRLLVTPQEAAKMLSLDRSTVYVLLMRGEIMSLKVGRARRIPVSALERWIEEQLVA